MVRLSDNDFVKDKDDCFDTVVMVVVVVGLLALAALALLCGS